MKQRGGSREGGRSTTRFAYLFFRSLFAHRQHTVITQATTTKAAIPAITGTMYNFQNPSSTDLSIGQNHINRIDYDKVKIISTEFTISTEGQILFISTGFIRSNIVHIYRIHSNEVKI